ncbi:MAG: HPF/RaiA family ribosome-associated protein [Oligoflexia bacterium]|nr:HPF/RaiA family ribosome-associated protein [Oligoflexia bacterium]
MLIKISTPNYIEGSESLTSHFQKNIESSLGHHSDIVTRLEVHFSDENGPKSGENDKRCMIEARIEGKKPMAVTHHSTSLDLALHGATEKLKRKLDSAVERLREHSQNGKESNEV